MTSRAAVLSIFLLAAVLPSAAMEIPVQRGTSSASKKGQVLAFVDMDRIYKEFPETLQARKDYQEQAGKMKAVLTDKEAELTDLREQLSILKAAAQDVSSSTSSAPVVRAPVVGASSSTAVNRSSFTMVNRSSSTLLNPVPPPAPSDLAAITGSMAEKEHMLAEQEADLAEAKKEAAKVLSDFERKRAAQIFGKLYKSLVQLADEKGVDVVLDKSALLYGQGGLDLTDALSRRVRGLPDEDAAP